MRNNLYLSELGISRAIYAGNFVTEKKRYRMYQRYKYGFDYRDIFNIDASFAEWLYSHMRMYRENSIHDEELHTVIFEENEFSIGEAIDWIIQKTGEYLRYKYYLDTHFDYVNRHPFKGKMLCRLNPSIREYLEDYDWSEEKEHEVEEDYIKAGRLFLEIMGYCWL